MADYSAVTENRGDWGGLFSRKDLSTGASSAYGFDQRGNARILLGGSGSSQAISSDNGGAWITGLLERPGASVVVEYRDVERVSAGGEESLCTLLI
jgi:hypothetical protein